MVFIDKRYFRPAEVDLLVADASKAERELGWKPKTSFDALVKEMIDHELQELDAMKYPARINKDAEREI